MRVGSWATPTSRTSARYRSADARGAEAVVFDVNDFDEAIVGPVSLGRRALADECHPGRA